jgi:phage terminase large subunit
MEELSLKKEGFFYIKNRYNHPMSLISTEKLSSVHSALQKAHTAQPKKKYCIQTFGCQMNYADSEKIHMLLSQA